MATVTVKRQATIELSEEDWKKIEAVQDMIKNLNSILEEIGLELNDPEVKYEGFGEGYAIGEQLESIYNAIDYIQCERSGLY